VSRSACAPTTTAAQQRPGKEKPENKDPKAREEKQKH